LKIEIGDWGQGKGRGNTLGVKGSLGDENPQMWIKHLDLSAYPALSRCASTAVNYSDSKSIGTRGTRKTNTSI